MEEERYPDEEYATLDEAAEEWKVTRGNIKYFINVKGVPTMRKVIDMPVKREMIHVHMPSLKKEKDKRIHAGPNTNKRDVR